MRRGRIFFYLAFIILLGLVAVAVIWFRFFQPKPSAPEVQVTTPPPVDLVNVVVLTQRVQRGGILNELVLGEVPIQRDLVIQGYYTDMAEVVGRRARVDLEANMILTTGMVVDTSEQLSETGSIAALSIPKGLVAISIPISRLSSVSYAPQAGDHVNIIVTLLLLDLDTEFQSALPNRSSAVIPTGPTVLLGMGTEKDGSENLNPDIVKITAQTVSGGPASIVGRTETDALLEQTFHVIPNESQRPRHVSQTLLQDAIVLHVGDYDPFRDEGAIEPAPLAVEEPLPDTQEGQVAAAPKPQLPDMITLIVTPQDAVTINYLMYAGAQLTLALRSAGDESRIQTEAATLDFLLKQYNIPVSVKLPYGVEPRLDKLTAPVLKNDVAPTPSP
jgi:Flp pilus assembly protein CpaB